MAKQPFENVVQHLFQIAAQAEFKILNDQELLQRYAEQRDELAFGELVRRYKMMIWYTCWRVLRNHQDVEDAFQATIMTLVRRATAILGRDSIEGWLHRVAYHLATKAKVMQARQHAREERSTSMRKTSYESQDWRWELEELVDKELDHIPEKYRGPLILSYWEGLSQKEAAQRLGITIDTLDWRLRQGRERLKQRLSKYGMELGPTMLMAQPAPGVHVPYVPNGLVERTLDMVRIMTLSNGALETTGISPQVATLVKSAMGVWTLKVKICLGVLLLTVAGVGTGVVRYPAFFLNFMGWTQPQNKKENPVNNKVDKPHANQVLPSTDLYGDPLPAGALARLGTVRLRPGHSSARTIDDKSNVVFTADGKRLITVEGQHTHLWDRETGKLIRKLSDPITNGEIILHTTKFSPDGKLRGGVKKPLKGQQVEVNASGPLCIWEAATGKMVCQWEIQGIQIQFKDKKKVRVPFIVRPRSWAFSPDSKSVIASYVWGDNLSEANSRLILWDIATGKNRWEQKEQMQGKLSVRVVTKLAISPDGSLVADGGYREKENEKHGKRVEAGILLRDGHTGKPLRMLGHPQVPDRLSFSPDGRTLLADYGNDCIHMWDVATSKEQWRMANGNGMCRFHAFSPNGKTVAIEYGGVFGYIILIEAATGKELCRCQESVSSRRIDGSVAFSPDGKILARLVGPLIRCWEVATGKIFSSSHAVGHETEVRSVAFAVDGKTLISEGANQAVHVWDTHTAHKKFTLHEESSLREEQFVLPAGGEAVTSPNGKVIVSKSVYFQKDGELELKGFIESVKNLRSSICLWDADTAKNLYKISLDDLVKTTNFRKTAIHILRGILGKIVLSPDSKLLAAAHYESGKVLFWEVNTGRRLDLKIEGTDPAFSPDGKFLMTLTEGKFSLWDLATGKKVSSASISKTASSGMQMTISDDWQVLATHTWDEGKKIEEINLYSLYRDHKSVRFGSPRAVTCPAKTRITSLALSPDGRMLACGGEGSGEPKSYTVHVWETAAGAERACFSGHKDRISSLSFSPDGRRLASGSADSTILVWDMTGGRLDNRGNLRSIQLSVQQIEQFWKDLRSTDGVRAGRAVWALSAAPQATIPFLAKHLSSISADRTAPQRIAKLIAELDDAQFSVRKKAMVELEKLGAAAEPSLREALTKQPPLEVRRRLLQLLDAVEAARQSPSGDVARVLRAIEVLEQIGSREAQQLLERLSQGTPGIRQTEEARASLCRWRHRGQP